MTSDMVIIHTYPHYDNNKDNTAMYFKHDLLLPPAVHC